MSETAEQAGVAARLAEVRTSIARASERAGRAADSVTLIAVSKSQPEERIVAALDAGQRIFGENYVQEAAGRWLKLRQSWTALEVHMIGALQSNKVAEAVALFDVIHTL